MSLGCSWELLSSAAVSGSPGINAPRVDEANECIWRGDRRLDLTPKAFLVLRRLMQQPQQIVTKSDLLDAAWPDTHVADGVLTLAINQLREAFGDDAREPRFIETVHRRGYRWIGAPVGSQAAGSEDDLPTPGLRPAPAPSLVVGREAALAQMDQALARAVAGSRQIVFVSGEPGIGKTTLLDAFVARLAAGAIPCAREPKRIALASGQCIDGFGTIEAYLPLLDGLERLCRESSSDDIVALLRRLAPTWLLQLPRLLKPGEQEQLRLSLAGTTGERMLRELLSFVEELTIDRTLVLLLEDLHWSDHATVGALAALATRREPARLLVLASYRPADAIAQLHPVTTLKHELRAKGRCIDIAVTGLERDGVAAYLDGRFPNHRLPPELAAQLQVHTAGNPLFLRNALEEFVQRDWLQQRDGAWECAVDLAALVGAVPESTREMIGFRLQQLTASDRHLLEAASVIGPSFATQALAAVVERHPADVEMDCARLVRAAQFLGEGQSTTWPDGSSGMQHVFAHALYQHVLYGGVTPARRELLHRRAAESLEKGFAEDAVMIAPQLALHFERGGDLERAVGHHRKAARRAMERYAYDPALEHLRSGLASISRLPADADRDAQEAAICAGLLTFARYSTGSTDLSPVIDRIQSLSTSAKTTPELLEALTVLAGYHTLCGDLRAARSVAEQAVGRADAVTWGSVLAKIARGRLGYCQIVQAEIHAGVANVESAMDVPGMSPATPFDPAIIATSDAGFGHCLLGLPSRARTLVRLALTRAEVAPPKMGNAALGALRVGIILNDDQLVEECVAHMESLPQTLRELWEGWAEIARGWLESNHGNPAGVDRILRAKETLRAGTLAYQRVPILMIAITALIRCGRHDEADVLITDALALGPEAGGHWFHAELYRLRAEVYLALRAQQRRASKKWQQLTQEAEDCLRRGLEVARSQGARWWELRNAVSLARLLSEGDCGAEGSDLLRSVYDEFTEGFELPDLRAAQAILQSS